MVSFHIGFHNANLTGEHGKQARAIREFMEEATCLTIGVSESGLLVWPSGFEVLGVGFKQPRVGFRVHQGLSSCSSAAERSPWDWRSATTAWRRVVKFMGEVPVQGFEVYSGHEGNTKC